MNLNEALGRLDEAVKSQQEAKKAAHAKTAFLFKKEEKLFKEYLRVAAERAVWGDLFFDGFGTLDMDWDDSETPEQNIQRLVKAAKDGARTAGVQDILSIDFNEIEKDLFREMQKVKVRL